MSLPRKPTRRDLLVVIQRLQIAIGDARAAYENDRNPDGFVQGRAILMDAHDLCVDATAQDPPLPDTGPWATKGT